MGKKKDLKKAMKAKREDIYSQVRMDSAGFYNFYSVPWDDSKYVKFPAGALTVPFQGVGRLDKIEFEIHEHGENAVGPGFDAFIKECYLGSARLTDVLRMARITNGRSELELE